MLIFSCFVVSGRESLVAIKGVRGVPAFREDTPWRGNRGVEVFELRSFRSFGTPLCSLEAAQDLSVSHPKVLHPGKSSMLERRGEPVAEVSCKDRKGVPACNSRPPLQLSKEPGGRSHRKLKKRPPPVVQDGFRTCPMGWKRQTSSWSTP